MTLPERAVIPDAKVLRHLVDALDEEAADDVDEQVEPPDEEEESGDVMTAPEIETVDL